MNLLYKIKYYLWASYRRKALDILQRKYEEYYQGVVLDIGGRDRGSFQKPKTKVKKWIFSDIEKKYKPDIILNVENMKSIESESIDVVNAIELFEHVEKPEAGLLECFRILKKRGIMFLSCPFLYQIHADPFDFQRWTLHKWENEFRKLKFKIIVSKINGYFFTQLSEMMKCCNKNFPLYLRWPGYLCYPLLDLLSLLDKASFVINHKVLNKFHCGYFFILKKT